MLAVVGYGAPAPSASVSRVDTRLPLTFEENHGQTDAQVKYLSRGRGYALFLTDDSAVIEAGKPSDSRVIRMRLAGANRQSRVAPDGPVVSSSNYLTGSDRAQWRTGVPQYSRVRYDDVYPGISLVYYGQEDQLEYDFSVAPGANPRAIRLQFEGQTDLRLAPNGDLLVGAGSSQMRLHRPSIYQPVAGKRIPVSGKFLLQGSEVRFQTGSYDKRQPIVIDPVLTYSTYLAGNYFDFPTAITVTTAGGPLAGAAIVTGSTYSSAFPVTAGVYQATCKISNVTGACGGDVFVAELSVDGSSLVYSTFLGGSAQDEATSIAVDSLGNAYVAGDTESADFPVTAGAVQSTCGACAIAGTNMFVAKLSPNGTALLYSTFLGGNTVDMASGVGLDPSGNVYLTGYTQSPNFPVTPSGLLTSCPGSPCGPAAVFSEINPSASGSAGLLYSTFIPGASYGTAIAVDPAGLAYIATTQDTAVPLGGAVYKFDATQLAGSSLIYSTPLAGVTVSSIAVSQAAVSTGMVYVTGATSGFGFAPPAGGFQTAVKGATDAYVVGLSTTGAITYATYLGGTDTSQSQAGVGIAIDGTGSVYVAGQTQASDFPVKAALEAQLNFSGNAAFDAFVSSFVPSLSKLNYSTFLGQGGVYGGVIPRGLAVGVSGSAFITGYSQGLTPNYPVSNVKTTAYELLPLVGSQFAGFVSKIGLVIPSGGAIAFAPGAINFGPQVTNMPSLPVSVLLMASANTPLTVTSITPSAHFAQTNNCPAVLSNGATCTINVTVTPTALGPLTGSLVIVDGSAGSPHSVPLTATGAPAVPIVVTNPVQVIFPPTPLNTPANIIPVQVTNTGAAVLNIISVSAGTGDFTSVNGCASTLAPNATCIINMTYTPTKLGPETGTLTITDNAANSPQTLPLTGSGPNYVVATAAASQTITHGQSASTQIQLTPQAGFNLKINLSCSSATLPVPAGLTCSTVPGTVTLDGVHTGTSTLNVLTTAATPPGVYKIRVNAQYLSNVIQNHTFFTVTVQ